MPHNFLIFGPPGSGKAELSQKISEEFNIVNLSVSQILREEVANGSGFGIETKKYFETDSIVPDDLIFDVILSRLKNINYENYIISGFPSSLSQARVGEFYLRKNNHPITMAISLGYSDVYKQINQFFDHKKILVTFSPKQDIINLIHKKINYVK